MKEKEKEKEAGTISLFTHQTFNLTYNGDQIISAKVAPGNPVQIGLTNTQLRVEFTYSVIWTKTEKKFKSRFERYLDSDFFENKVHWFSIFNALMMVLFLTGFVSAMWIRYLRRDFARYDKETGLNDFVRNQPSPPVYLKTRQHDMVSNME